MTKRPTRSDSRTHMNSQHTTMFLISCAGGVYVDVGTMHLHHFCRHLSTNSHIPPDWFATNLWACEMSCDDLTHNQVTCAHTTKNKIQARTKYKKNNNKQTVTNHKKNKIRRRRRTTTNKKCNTKNKIQEQQQVQWLGGGVWGFSGSVWI